MKVSPVASVLTYSGPIQWARGGSRAKAPPLAARPGSVRACVCVRPTFHNPAYGNALRFLCCRVTIGLTEHFRHGNTAKSAGGAGS